MKKIIIILFVVFLVFTAILKVDAEKVAIIGEVMKPESIEVDDTQLYVVEGTSIFMYSLKDYKFIRKIGKEGQGPQEFAILPGVTISVAVSGESIVVNSFGKVSYFKKDGTFEREIKTKSLSFYMKPFTGGFLGIGRLQEEGIAYNTINLYDGELNKIKEITRNKVMKTGGKIYVLNKSFSYEPYKDRCYVTGDTGMTIDVFDKDGNKLHSITHEYEKIKFDPKVETAIRDNMKRQYGPQYDLIKDNLEFPDYFPEILNFFIENDKVFVATWKREKGQFEFFIFDVAGKFLEKRFINMAVMDNGTTPYPPTVYNGKLYQLIENDKEEWELHITKL